MRGWVALSTLTLMSCIHTGGLFIDVSSSALPGGDTGLRYAAHEVDVLLGTDVVAEDCERVAILHASGHGEVLDQLRAQAGLLGANTIDIRAEALAGDGRSTHSLTDGDSSEEHWDALALFCP